MDINVIEANNGWLVTSNEGCLVVEDITTYKDYSRNQAETIRKLLWTIREVMGLHYDKHSEYNCDIVIVNNTGKILYDDDVCEEEDEKENEKEDNNSGIVQ